MGSKSSTKPQKSWLYNTFGLPTLEDTTDEKEISKKWADSYGFHREKTEIEKVLEQKLPNVLGRIISRYTGNRDVLIAFIIKKQNELIKKINIVSAGDYERFETVIGNRVW